MTNKQNIRSHRAYYSKGWIKFKKKSILKSKDFLILLLVLISVCMIGYNQVKLETEITSIGASVAQFQAKHTLKVNKTSDKVIMLKTGSEGFKAKYAYMNGNWSKEQLKIRVATELKIMEIAKAEGFQYTSYMIRLIDCESMLNLVRENKKYNHPANSKDRGIAMINSYWHSDISDEQAYNDDFAIKWTMNMINKGLQTRWSCNSIVKGKENFR